MTDLNVLAAFREYPFLRKIASPHEVGSFRLKEWDAEFLFWRQETVFIGDGLQLGWQYASVIGLVDRKGDIVDTIGTFGGWFINLILFFLPKVLRDCTVAEALDELGEEAEDILYAVVYDNPNGVDGWNMGQPIHQMDLYKLPDGISNARELLDNCIEKQRAKTTMKY